MCNFSDIWMKDQFRNNNGKRIFNLSEEIDMIVEQKIWGDISNFSISRKCIAKEENESSRHFSEFRAIMHARGAIRSTPGYASLTGV